MRIREEIAEKHWREAAIDELVNKYAAQGYEIQRGAPIGDARADLVLRKGEELIVMEVKAGDWSQEKTRQVQNIRQQVVHQLGGKFNLVLVSPPQEKFIEIGGLEKILFNILMTDLKQHSDLSVDHIDEVADVTIASITVDQNRIHVSGSGIVSVVLNMKTEAGTIPSSMTTSTDSYPFDFKLVLDGELNVLEVANLKIETVGGDD